jgi:hypothetical protein
METFSWVVSFSIIGGSGKVKFAGTISSFSSRVRLYKGSAYIDLSDAVTFYT